LYKITDLVSGILYIVFRGASKLLYSLEDENAGAMDSQQTVPRGGG